MAYILTHMAKKGQKACQSKHCDKRGPKLNWDKLPVEVGTEAQVEDKPGVEVETETEVENKRPAQDEIQDQEKR